MDSWGEKTLPVCRSMEARHWGELTPRGRQLCVRLGHGRHGVQGGINEWQPNNLHINGLTSLAKGGAVRVSSMSKWAPPHLRCSTAMLTFRTSCSIVVSGLGRVTCSCTYAIIFPCQFTRCVHTDQDEASFLRGRSNKRTIPDGLGWRAVCCCPRNRLNGIQYRKSRVLFAEHESILEIKQNLCMCDWVCARWFVWVFVWSLYKIKVCLIFPR